jgi:hypothetical protein
MYVRHRIVTSLLHGEPSVIAGRISATLTSNDVQPVRGHKIFLWGLLVIQKEDRVMTRFSVTIGAAAIAALAVAPAWAPAWADDGVGRIEDGVANANAKVGAPSTLVDPDFKLNVIAAGIDPLENPSGVITNFGALSTGTLTEPDENTYLVLDHNPGGPTPGFDYGRHFLFQGHENGAPLAYVTRINLDVPRNSPHRITLLTPVDPSTQQTGFGSVDGSTFNPFTKTMLFTQEAGTAGGVIQITLQWPVQVNTLDAFLGKAGYEGIHPDNKGNIYLVEDTGGATSATPSLNKGRQPNSFVYRYVPNNPARIEDGGDLQALQVIIDGSPVVFGGPSSVDADISAQAQLKLHTLGTSFPVKWVTIHTAHKGDTVSFDANAAAKAAGATPFKRPENMTWLPGSEFKTFYFCPTGDTDSVAGDNPFLQARGAYGSIFRVDLAEHRDGDHDRHETAGEGRISLFFLGDHTHNSFDNLTFANEHQLMATEDRGDLLHTELNTLDSVWAFDVRKPGKSPIRFVALGRDANSIIHGEDNEPTGLFVSNGSSSKSGMLGTEDGLDGARGFFTQQHGDNILYEFVRNKHHEASRD